MDTESLFTIQKGYLGAYLQKHNNEVEKWDRPGRQATKGFINGLRPYDVVNVHEQVPLRAFWKYGWNAPQNYSTRERKCAPRKRLWPQWRRCRKPSASSCREPYRRHLRWAEGNWWATHRAKQQVASWPCDHAGVLWHSLSNSECLMLSLGYQSSAAFYLYTRCKQGYLSLGSRKEFPGLDIRAGTMCFSSSQFLSIPLMSKPNIFQPPPHTQNANLT